MRTNATQMSDGDPAHAARRKEAKGQGEAEFDALVRAEYSGLVSFVERYVRSRATAEDIAQDVFAAVWRQGGRVPFAEARPYLYRSARNRALDHIRNERIREHHAARSDSPAMEAAPVVQELELSELASAVAAAMNVLPERTRAVFLLSRDQGMRYAEIARTLGISQKTVEAQMARAFRALRLALSPYLDE